MSVNKIPGFMDDDFLVEVTNAESSRVDVDQDASKKYWEKQLPTEKGALSSGPNDCEEELKGFSNVQIKHLRPLIRKIIEASTKKISLVSVMGNYLRVERKAMNFETEVDNRNGKTAVSMIEAL